jgi:hypothetical protein
MKFVDFGGFTGIIEPIGKEVVTRLSGSPPGSVTLS